MKTSDTLDNLFADLIALQSNSVTKLPPVHLWNPKNSGDMDIRIDREGRWIHEGGEIKRPALVKLFSSILKLENNQYFLVTPVEKWKISVEVAPFFITQVTRVVRNDQQAISCMTLNDETIILNEDHPLIIKYESLSDEPTPLVKVRGNLWALVSRSAFYQLVAWGENPSGNEDNAVYLTSMGRQFLLGKST
ncbi:MAG: hypothetical protein ABS24_04860 [SAR92 bacterium BACL26 MAG-121220-bin70]|mgnify:CR=1 FL=1|jgi:uncharacterized protein|uniref:Proteophosphoglycan n=1 Tax=SAR92 bacterium BACL26 MAG-121220-bin70 TaxID=1655626 RepID=A0A0R2TWN2_9GAMM|nr:MAG: hypothetical protein ABS24_04860 [SAR92 bacterium BACL26 MAG-121220-bin70]